MKDFIKMINEIIRLPAIFHEQSDSSIFELLKKTGYFECFEKVNEKTIKLELEKNEFLIKNWKDWSSSKRTESGWFLKFENENNIVSFYPETYDKSLYIFDNIIDAVSKYIKIEIEEIRSGN